MKWYHFLFGALAVIGISLIVARESGVAITPYFFLPYMITIASIVGVYFLFTKVILKKQVSPKGIGKLSIEDVKFIAVSHLLNQHGINIFSNGNQNDSKSARYIVPVFANQCFPSRGVQYWFVRLTLKDKRYFGGEFTRAVIYIDNDGNVVGDLLMNNSTFIDYDMWKRPEKWFVQSPSKTPEPRTLSQIRAEKFEETGEIIGMPKEEAEEEEKEGK